MITLGVQWCSSTRTQTLRALGGKIEAGRSLKRPSELLAFSYTKRECVYAYVQ